MEKTLRNALYEEIDGNVRKDSEDRSLLDAIERLADSLIKKRNEAVIARASTGIERIWREDELLYEGEDIKPAGMIDYASGNVAANDAKRSRVAINVIRPKCETAVGRFSEIQIPTEGKNWGLKPTPVPDLVSSLKDTRPAALRATNQPLVRPDGKPVTIQEVAHHDRDVIEEKMRKMENQIHDQLVECSFNSECRKVIQDAVRLGTGVMKGICIVKNVNKSWTKIEDENGNVARVLKIHESPRPVSRRVDIWDVYPDPDCGEDIRKAGYIWEKRMITPRELRSLIGLEGYLEDQIRAVLEEEPNKVNAVIGTDRRVKYNSATRGASYELWEYNGDVDKSDLEALGCECSSDMPSISACVIMVNNRPIKATLNPLDTGELPYDFFVWSKRAGMVWGTGVARELFWPQRVINAAWRAMMDNAGDSSGANIVVGSSIEPMDGRWEITGKKLWKTTDESLDIKKQFGQFQIKNNQQELQSIIEMALRFADIETQSPMIFSGEKGDLPRTLGATNIIVDSANIAFRSRVKLWDDTITVPHIRRYYDWNMQYHEDDSIKGDYKVDASGSSVLFEKEQQRQRAAEIMPLRGDVELRDMIDWKKIIKKLNIDMLPEETILEKENLRKQQPAPVDVDVQVAQIRANGELEKARFVAEAEMRGQETKAQIAELNRQHQLVIKQMERDMKAMELSQASGIALDKIKAELTIMAQKLNTQVAMAKDRTLGASPQLTEEAYEPPAKARTGYAFTE